ncbi:MAG: RlmI/RlmK family 23S rRNA methyltransferase [Arcobacter sp.]|nr:MAG: RlmI/RlmK family 23S rRNA methyltransferase [Arcobacter sp.]
MKNTIDIKVKAKYIQEYQDRYPLIKKEIIENIDDLKEEGTIINLMTINNKFIGKGYYGKQNKGYGWILSYDKNETIDTAFFVKKIKESVAYRKNFYKESEQNITTAFRIVNGEGDGLGGVTIDYFNGFYMITWYSLGIYSFKDMIVAALQKSVDYKGIYEKKRFDRKGQYLENKSDFICGMEASSPLIIKENSINFAIYLDDGAMTGLFLDQREVRKNIRDKYSLGKTMFNAFSYTGAFSVYSALGGAIKTTNVDVAKRSLAKTKEQFELNNIDIQSQEIIVDDVFEYFKFAVRKQYTFDTVVLDPPSFARTKKMTFSVSKDYVKLLKEAIQITNKNGIIVASTNFANFGMMKFRQFIEQAFKELKVRYKILQTYSLPKDFRVCDEFKEGDYLKVVFIKKI